MRMYKTITWQSLRLPLVPGAKKKIRIFSLGPAASESTSSILGHAFLYSQVVYQSRIKLTWYVEWKRLWILNQEELGLIYCIILILDMISERLMELRVKMTIFWDWSSSVCNYQNLFKYCWICYSSI